MPDLQRALQGNDLGFLRMVADAWGIELTAPDAYTALPVLVHELLNPSLAAEIVESLPAGARQALLALLENEGRLPWAQFCRRFGEVREMGAARRDRERPDLKPASPAEVLFYRALVARAFLQSTAEPQEYAYIPDDLLEILPPLAEAADKPPGRPASPGECAFPIPADDHILDHAATLLAGLRVGLDAAALQPFLGGMPLEALRGLLDCAGLLDRKGVPLPEPVRAFLESPRPQALALLASRWMESRFFNELRLLPGLVFEGEWLNDPLQARRVLLDLASAIPPQTWWSLPAFLAAVKEKHPDFQRTGGDYDSWFIRRADSENYLRGFASWDEVDGALVRYLITAPLHWLGMLDLAAPAEDAAPAAFRLSQRAESLWRGAPPTVTTSEDGALRCASDGRITLPADFPRAARYQVARFCHWEGEKDGCAVFRLTPAALERAQKQGLRPAHLTALLRKHSATPLPPAVLQSLERWEKSGTEVRLEHALLLRVKSPEILSALAKTRASRWLGEALTPTIVVILPGGEEAVLSALAALGYLAGVDWENEE